MIDLISRQAAIKYICTMLKNCFNATDEMLESVKITVGEMPYVPDTNVGDMISRQAAMDALDRLEYTPGEWATNGLTMCKDVIKALPPAQPEIIRCKDCRHNHNCDIQYHAQAGDMFFCAGAERRTDE